MGKLLIEEINDCQFTITEAAGGSKKYVIEGIFMQAEIANKNGRVYPRHILEREASRYNKNYIQENRAFGELNHPAGPQINLDRVSHMITDLYPDGNNWVGKAKILDTPMGRIVKNFMDEGAKLGVSTRGVGSLKSMKEGLDQVQDDYRLATAADIVADPSGPDAFVRGIMEGKEWVMEAGNWKEIDYEQAKKAIQEAHRIDYEDTVLREFSRFINSI